MKDILNTCTGSGLGMELSGELGQNLSHAI